MPFRRGARSWAIRSPMCSANRPAYLFFALCSSDCFGRGFAALRTFAMTFAPSGAGGLFDDLAAIGGSSHGPGHPVHVELHIFEETVFETQATNFGAAVEPCGG